MGLSCIAVADALTISIVSAAVSLSISIPTTAPVPRFFASYIILFIAIARPSRGFASYAPDRTSTISVMSWYHMPQNICNHNGFPTYNSFWQISNASWYFRRCWALDIWFGWTDLSMFFYPISRRFASIDPLTINPAIIKIIINVLATWAACLFHFIMVKWNPVVFSQLTSYSK